jgi:hypothetical protein
MREFQRSIHKSRLPNPNQSHLDDLPTIRPSELTRQQDALHARSLDYGCFSSVIGPISRCLLCARCILWASFLVAHGSPTVGRQPKCPFNLFNPTSGQLPTPHVCTCANKVPFGIIGFTFSNNERNPGRTITVDQMARPNVSPTFTDNVSFGPPDSSATYGFFSSCLRRVADRARSVLR